MNKPKSIFCWSGGKDSAYCLHKVLSERTYDIRYLFTTINDKYKRISMHGVREELKSLQTHRGKNRTCFHVTIKHERILVLRFNSGIKNMLCSWSGGKDSCYAMMQSMQLGYQPKVLLNMLNENGKVSRSHALPLEILKQQAGQLRLPLVALPTSWNDYERNFIEILGKLKKTYNLDYAVFGDIDLQPHRDWEEKVSEASKIKALLPLWRRNRKELVLEMLDSKIECMIVSCKTTMREKYLGKTITKKLTDELEQTGIDPCGEKGEFHTLVVNCPLFYRRISLPAYKIQTYNDYCFINWKI